MVHSWKIKKQVRAIYSELKDSGIKDWKSSKNYLKENHPIFSKTCTNWIAHGIFDSVKKKTVSVFDTYVKKVMSSKKQFIKKLNLDE